MSSERVRLAVECAMDAVRHLDPAELDDAIEQLEREMIALAERRRCVRRPFRASFNAGVERVAEHVENGWEKYVDEEKVPLVATIRAFKAPTP